MYGRLCRANQTSGAQVGGLAAANRLRSAMLWSEETAVESVLLEIYVSVTLNADAKLSRLLTVLALEERTKRRTKEPSGAHLYLRS